MSLSLLVNTLLKLSQVQLGTMPKGTVILILFKKIQLVYKKIIKRYMCLRYISQKNLVHMIETYHGGWYKTKYTRDMNRENSTHIKKTYHNERHKGKMCSRRV